MSEISMPGYYQDHNGEWQIERRADPERRLRKGNWGHHDRRANYRRKTDEHIKERDAHTQIDEAMMDFDQEHQR